MTNRVQTLRSSTRGQRPSGQPPGVLWVTYPDNAFGVVDAGGAAFDLLAVRFFSSLAAYVVGDYVKQGTLVYRCITANGPGAFNGANWSQIQTAADIATVAYAPLASPVFTGDPQAPTPAPGDSDTSIATTAFVATSFAPLASPIFTGSPVAPTPLAGDNDTSIATTAFVTGGITTAVAAAVAPLAPIASPVFTGNPTAPTPPLGDNDTSIATTAFVTAAVGSGTRGDGVNILRRNGGLEVWQRGAGGSASIGCPAGAATYTADGWYLNTGAGQVSTVVQGVGLTNGSQSSATIARNAGQTGVGVMAFGFPLDTDELWPALGQFVRLSLVLKANAGWSPTAGNISIAVATGTAAPGKLAAGAFVGRVDVISALQPLTTTATRYQFNSSVVVPVNTRQMEVILTWTPIGTSSGDSFIIDDVQLEIVPAATGYVSSDFERLNFQEQLALCQRHYQKTFNYGIAPASAVGANTGELPWSQAVPASTVQAGFNWPFSVPMRVNPTVLATYNPIGTGTQVRNTFSNNDWSATSLSSVGQKSVSWFATSPNPSVAGHSAILHATADAGI